MKHQIAALPIVTAGDGKTSVVLLTSRETRRWIIPKGWPMKGLKDHEAAAREAFEEAGLVGAIEKKPIGSYNYFKRRADGYEHCDVAVYLMHVDRQLTKYPEKGERTIVTVPLEEAFARVDEVGLKAILRQMVDGGQTPV
jgi:8-oxo-dGTP pyrophosphatase MutT (NUDIX family)